MGFDSLHCDEDFLERKVCGWRHARLENGMPSGAGFDSYAFREQVCLFTFLSGCSSIGERVVGDDEAAGAIPATQTNGCRLTVGQRESRRHTSPVCRADDDA